MSYTLKHGAIALLLIFLPICHAVLVNRTIDSNLGDPVTNFQPIYRSTPGEDHWDDETCTNCNINPDAAVAFDHTFMSATYFPHDQPLEGINITLQFTGVAVWVFFILSNTNVNGNPFVSTHCNFTLDGQHAGSFSHEPDSTTTAFMYNVAVFSQSGLSNTPHELIVSVNDYPIPVWVCFDYAVYTSQTDTSNATSSSGTIGSPSTTAASSALITSSAASQSSQPVDPSNTITSSPSSSNSSNAAASQSTTTQTPKTGVIVGSVIGALALIGLLVLLVFIWRRRSHRPNNGPVPNAFLNAGIAPTSSGYLSTKDSHRGLVSSGTSLPIAADNGNFMPSSSGVALIPVLSSDRRREKELAMRQVDINDRSPASHETQRSNGTPVPEVQDIASLHGQIQELRNQMEQLQNQPQPSGTLTSYDGPLPPPYR